MNTTTKASPRQQLAAASLNVPQGVGGKQREAYLTLTDRQKVAYRYDFYVRGRLAAHCYRAAVGAE